MLTRMKRTFNQRSDDLGSKVTSLGPWWEGHRFRHNMYHRTFRASAAISSSRTDNCWFLRTISVQILVVLTGCSNRLFTTLMISYKRLPHKGQTPNISRKMSKGSRSVSMSSGLMSKSSCTCRSVRSPCGRWRSTWINPPFELDFFSCRRAYD